MFGCFLIVGLLLTACGPEAPATPASSQEPEPAPVMEPTQDPVAEPTEEPAPEKMVFTDDLGNTIELDGISAGDCIHFRFHY